MSHLKERKEKDCLNCGAEVGGRYCHICGQENIEPKESFWHLTTHLIYDITHFDGKFFSTLKYLLFKPGFLSHEYLRGRRASYLHPIRMYVFTSAFFFLVFFSLKKDEDVVTVNDGQDTAAVLLKKLEKRKNVYAKALNDSLPEIAKRPILQQIAYADSDIAMLKADTTAKDRLRSFKGDNTFHLFSSGKDDTLYKSVATYEREQARLAKEKRDNFIRRHFRKQNIHLREKYKGDSKAIFNAILEKFKHLFPQMLFVSLPLFALMLKLLYFRKRKFYYVNHVVFAIHLYCGTFIIILCGMLLSLLAESVSISDDWIAIPFMLAGFFFWYKSMRNFYEQRRSKTILKYILVLLMSLLIMAALFFVFFIFSAMSI